MMMMSMGRAIFGEVGAILASLIFIWGTLKQYLPDSLAERIATWQQKLKAYYFPTIQITFDEFSAGLHNRNDAYTAIENYLSTKSSSPSITRLKGESLKKNKQSLVFTSEDYENVEDEFNGVQVKWYKARRSNHNQLMIYSGHVPQDKKYYSLSFHPKYREIVMNQYLGYVLMAGKKIKAGRKQRRIYTNSSDNEGYWDYTMLEHPANFDAFAMDPEKKREIMDDLKAFSEGKEKYAKIGKPWKRGYLLYGPPGTGKSTLIMAMSKLLDYDVYDLELTTVKDNAQLKSLLLNSAPKGIFVVEDIDCSLEITAKRKNKNKNKNDDKDKNSDDDEDEDEDEEDEEKAGKKKSKVTLSGFLNFVDGIWSACGGERIFVFTTNHVDKLDPALLRKGRMDVHIELSYCSFGAFKVLAKNHLELDSHPLFDKIGELLGEVNMAPAEVSENLLHSQLIKRDPESSLQSLIQVLETAKEKDLKQEKEAAAKKEEEAAKEKEEEAKRKEKEAAKEKEEAKRKEEEAAAREKAKRLEEEAARKDRRNYLRQRRSHQGGRRERR